MKLTLGACLFNWPATLWRDFYFRIADEADVDTVCVGEVVCSKRSPFFAPHIAEVVERLQKGGKEVVLSSLALIMNERELAEARDLAEGAELPVEANDMATAAFLDGKNFVAGPLLNIYGEGTVSVLYGMGARRICLPAELSGDAIAALIANSPKDINFEVQAFGRLPLAISARCYHARSRGLSKDGCQYVCAEDLNGMDVDTLDDQEFLAVNGTQTMSYHTLNLLGEIPLLEKIGVSRLRLWPQHIDMVAAASLFRAVTNGSMDAAEATEKLQALWPAACFANGYIHGREGRVYVEE